MSEELVLTTPETTPATVAWRISQIHIDVDEPSIKVELRSPVGKIYGWALIPIDEDPTVEAKIRTGLSFINQGKFKTVKGQSLQRWLLEQISASGAKVGSVSGTPT